MTDSAPPLPGAFRSPLRQFLLFFLPAAVLLGLAVVLFQYGQYRSDMQGLQAREEALVDLGRTVISAEFHRVNADLFALALSPLLQTYLANPSRRSLDDLRQAYFTLSLCTSLYDQIRLLDHRGREVIRVNHENGRPRVVPDGELQDKGQRYYFADTFRLERGEVYVSPMDLNIERGELERPLKPMIRFGTPVFDQEGRKRGVVLLNYYGRVLTDRIQNVMTSGLARYLAKEGARRPAAEALRGVMPTNVPMLLNSEGHWLLAGGRPEQEWGFMLGHGRSFAGDFPVAWRVIAVQESGQHVDEQGMFTFTTVYPLLEGQVSSGSAAAPGKYRWKLLSHVDRRRLDGVAAAAARMGALFYGVVLLLLAPACWYFGQARSSRQQVEMQRQQYESIVNSSHDLMTLIGPDYRYRAVSDSFCILHGRRRDEILGRTVADLWGEELFRDEIREHLDRCLAGGRVRYSAWFAVPGSGRRHFDVVYTPYRSVPLDELRAVVVSRDTTGRKRTLERIGAMNELRGALLKPASLDDKLKRIVEQVVAIFGADFCRIWLIRKGDHCGRGCPHAVAGGAMACSRRERCLHLRASAGRYTHLDGEHRRVPMGCLKIGSLAAGLETKYRTNDLLNDPGLQRRHWAEELGLTAFAGYRLLSEAGLAIGVLALFSRTPISREDDASLEGLAATTAQVIQVAAVEEEREGLIEELQQALAQVKTLGKLLPICASCKKIRDDQGYWNQIEAYIHRHSGTEFSHSICPECARRLYPGLYAKKKP